MANSLSRLLTLRVLVATLGEAHHEKWWRSQFLSRTGLSFLERVYPRSVFAAALRSATRAARTVHDASIGKGTVSHLFRLDPELERRLDAALSDNGQELEMQFRSLLMEGNTLLAELESLAAGFEIEVLVGPVRVEVEEDEFVPALAAIYLAAFRHGNEVFPYVEEEMAVV